MPASGLDRVMNPPEGRSAQKPMRLDRHHRDGYNVPTPIRRHPFIRPLGRFSFDSRAEGDSTEAMVAATVSPKSALLEERIHWRLVRLMRLWHLRVAPKVAAGLVVFACVLLGTSHWKWPLLALAAFALPALAAVLAFRGREIEGCRWWRLSLAAGRMVGLTLLSMLTMNGRTSSQITFGQGGYQSQPATSAPIGPIDRPAVGLALQGEQSR